MAGEDPLYTGCVRQLPCCAPPSACRGMITAHHHTRGTGERRGKGQRVHDHDTMPLCFHHHLQFHDAAGPFRGWDKAQRIAWQDEKVAETWEKVHALRISW